MRGQAVDVEAHQVDVGRDAAGEGVDEQLGHGDPAVGDGPLDDRGVDPRLLEDDPYAGGLDQLVEFGQLPRRGLAARALENLSEDLEAVARGEIGVARMIHRPS